MVPVILLLGLRIVIVSYIVDVIGLPMVVGSIPKVCSGLLVVGRQKRGRNGHATRQSAIVSHRLEGVRRMGYLQGRLNL